MFYSHTIRKIWIVLINVLPFMSGLESDRGDKVYVSHWRGILLYKEKSRTKVANMAS